MTKVEKIARYNKAIATLPAVALTVLPLLGIEQTPELQKLINSAVATATAVLVCLVPNAATK